MKHLLLLLVAIAFNTSVQAQHFNRDSLWRARDSVRVYDDSVRAYKKAYYDTAKATLTMSVGQSGYISNYTTDPAILSVLSDAVGTKTNLNQSITVVVYRRSILNFYSHLGKVPEKYGASENLALQMVLGPTIMTDPILHEDIQAISDSYDVEVIKIKEAGLIKLKEIYNLRHLGE